MWIPKLCHTMFMVGYEINEMTMANSILLNFSHVDKFRVSQLFLCYLE